MGKKISELPSLTDEQLESKIGILGDPSTDELFKATRDQLGGNFANTDLSANADRTHNFNSHSLTIQNLTTFSLSGASGTVTENYVEGSVDDGTGEFPYPVPSFIPNTGSGDPGFIMTFPNNTNSISVKLNLDGTETDVVFFFLQVLNNVGFYITTTDLSIYTLVTPISYTYELSGEVQINATVQEKAANLFDTVNDKIAIFDTSGNLIKVNASILTGGDFTTTVFTDGTTITGDGSEGNPLIATPPTDTGGGFEIKGEYANNQDALSGGLQDGEVYSLPLPDGSDAVAYLAVARSIVINPGGGLSLPLTNLTGKTVQIANLTSNTQQNFQVSWGDGQNYYATNVTQFGGASHTYTSDTAILTISASATLGTITFLSFLFGDCTVDFTNLNSDLSALSTLQINSCQILSNSLQLQSVNTLYQFTLYNCPLSVFPNFLPTSIGYINISSNGLTSIPNITSAYPNLNSLYVQSQNFSATGSLPSQYPLQLVNLGLNVCSLQSYPDIQYPLGLQTFILQGNQIPSFNPTNALPSSLKVFDIGNNLLTVFNPTAHALPSGLQTLHIGSNLLSDFNPTAHGLPSGLLYLDISANPFHALTLPDLPNTLLQLSMQSLNEVEMTGFPATWNLPDNLQYLTIRYNAQYNQAAIDSLLNRLDTKGYAGGDKNFYLDFNNTPSSTGLTHKANLIARGCHVFTA